MEKMNRNSNAKLWVGRIITALCILFLLADAIMKVAKSAQSVQGSTQVGWPEQSIPALGYLLLACTLLYLVPKTAVLGAILLTGYLGGATAIMFRAELSGHPYWFPVLFGILIWAGLFLRDEKLRALLPFRNQMRS